MERCRTLSLIIAVAVLAISVWQSLTGSMPFSLHPHCPLADRLAYVFFHANFLHALLNVWCMLTAVFLYGMHTRHLIWSYVIAVSFPITALATALAPPMPDVIADISGISPTVGLSGVCFALMGFASSRARKPMVLHRFVVTVIAFMAAAPFALSLIGLESASAANALHAYCYITAALISRRVWLTTYPS